MLLIMQPVWLAVAGEPFIWLDSATQYSGRSLT